MEARPPCLRWAAAQCVDTIQGNTTCGAARDWSRILQHVCNAPCPRKLARLSKGTLVAEPTELSVRVGVQTKFLTLSGNLQSIATRTCGCGGRTRQGNRLSTLKCRDPIQTPAS